MNITAVMDLRLIIYSGISFFSHRCICPLEVDNSLCVDLVGEALTPRNIKQQKKRKKILSWAILQYQNFFTGMNMAYYKAPLWLQRKISGGKMVALSPYGLHARSVFLQGCEEEKLSGVFDFVAGSEVCRADPRCHFKGYSFQSCSII